MKNLIYFLLLTSSLLLYATSKNDADEIIYNGEISIYTDSLVSVYREGDEHKDLVHCQMLQNGGKIVPITIPLLNSVININYNGSTALKFYGKGEIREENVIAQCELDPRSKNTKILFLPLSEGKYQMYPIPADRPNFENGTLMVLNCSSDTISSHIANQNTTTKPGKLNIVSLSEVKNFQLKMLHKVDDEIIYTAKKSINKNDKFLLFIYKRFGNTGPWRSKLIRVADSEDL